MSLFAQSFLLAAILAAPPALAQAPTFAEASAAFVDAISALSPAECAADLAARELRFQAAGDVGPGPLRNILEAEQMICASGRLEVARLSWAGKARNHNLVTVPNGAENEVAEAPALGAHETETTPALDKQVKFVFEFGKDIAVLRRDAVALLQKTEDALPDLSPQQAGQFKLAIDSEAKHSIFDRFRESLPREN